ncbi:MAG: DUF4062 domain-containing protein, partial [Phascolarctobacterium sp.]
VITRTIDDTDYYVLIIGDSYGSVITLEDGSIMSFTQKEYMYAKSKNIPILAFIKEKSTFVDPGDINKNHIPELNDFKDIVKKERNVSFWENADDLAAKVTASLYRAMSEVDRPGWKRNSEFSSSQVVDNQITVNTICNSDTNAGNKDNENKYIGSEYKLKERFFQICVKYKVEYFLRNCSPMAGLASDYYDLFDTSIEAIEAVLYDAPMLKDSSTYKDIQRFINCSKEYSSFIYERCKMSSNGKFVKFDNQKFYKNQDSVNNKMILYRKLLIDLYEAIGKNRVKIFEA